jgi:hypothetical protein
MISMSRFRGLKFFFIGSVALAFLGDAGCSRPVGIPGEEGTAQTGQAPFQDTATKEETTGLGDPFPVRGDANPANSPPFRDRQNLPAGTLLMVRLTDSIPTQKLEGRDSFEASLDEPVVVEGNTLIPRGAAVTGRVQSVRTSNVKPSRGYVRLALESVRVAGTDLPVQTASLFVRQSPQNDISSPSIHLEKGHRLTFRLSEPVYTTNQGLRIAR